MTGNFDGENTKFIEKLEIENLKSFYFSKNKITNLNYIKDIKFKRLEKLCTTDNKITDIKEIMNIQNKKNIKIINLKGNNINNFNELLNIIYYFPKLEELLLVKNIIYKSEVVEMKKKIKNLYKQ